MVVINKVSIFANEINVSMANIDKVKLICKEYVEKKPKYRLDFLGTIRGLEVGQWVKIENDEYPINVARQTCSGRADGVFSVMKADEGSYVVIKIND